MREWVGAQIASLTESLAPVRLVLDPDEILTASETAEIGQSVVVRSWHELRSAYELSGRDRVADDDPLVVIVVSKEFAEPNHLPFDITQDSIVCRLRIPGPEELRPIVKALPENVQDIAVASYGRRGDPLENLVGTIWGVSLPPVGVSVSDGLAAVIQLRSGSSVPAELWPAAANRIMSPLAQGLLQEPPDMELLQGAWEDWMVHGEDSQWHSTFEAVGQRITGLFYAGLLHSVSTNRQVPAWATAGRKLESWYEAAVALLESPPIDGIPSDLPTWVRLAEWWGDTRLALALGSPESTDLAARSWEMWEPWDAAFRSYLHEHLGMLMSSAIGRPQTVNQIGGYLARRLREGKAKRIMLVVFDGMGFTQWSLIRRTSGLVVTDAQGVLAMAPSLTPISRQSIFAGALPLTFSDSFENTKNERSLWERMWENEGVPVSAVGYKNIEGVDALEVPHFPDELAVGVVVRAVDELMHTSELLPEPQFARNVQGWLQHGFVRKLVESAVADGFEVWFTSDHGSIEVVPDGRPMEGLRVDVAGTRVRLYKTAALRDQSNADGDAWDPPGMPADGPYALFPWGRAGFRNDVRVTHGGPSFDEMIVPFVRVSI